MNKFRVSVEELRSGTYLARPSGQLGNVGNWPFLWTAVTATSAENAKRKFLHEYADQIAVFNAKGKCHG